uniref:Uncharacterized protein n=1 Tax=Ditylenchus dipsaci TaxID=166011 RepID=A0A915CVT3_9BILA
MKQTIIPGLFIYLALHISLNNQIEAKKHKKRDESSSESKEESNPAIDRLAVNLAGAFVKSIFPEIDGSVGSNQQQANDQETKPVSNQIRRAPSASLSLLQQGAGPAFPALQQQGSQQVANPFGDISSSSLFSTGSQQGSLGSLAGLLPTSQLTSLIPSLHSDNSNSAATVEAINAAKRQKYLIELQRHQNELNQYSGKQLEYLDQQRRYQEAMVNHQAGAALLMQQQQQDFLNKMKNRYAGFHDQTTNDHHPSTTHDDTNSGDKTKDSETMERLKQFLNGRQLDEKMKEGILKKFKALQHLDKETPRKAQPKQSDIWSRNWKSYWKDQVLSKTYSTFLSLLEFNNKEQSEEMGMDEPLTVNITTKRASCVGLEIGGKKSGKNYVGVNIYFRDDTSNHELYEINGRGKVVDNTLQMDLDLMQTSVCVVKAGPAEVNVYEYVVLADTSGSAQDNKCTSYHVFSRDTDEFHLRYYDDVADFLKTQVMNDRRILPVAALPSPKLCQLSSDMNR